MKPTSRLSSAMSMPVVTSVDVIVVGEVVSEVSSVDVVAVDGDVTVESSPPGDILDVLILS